jgi:oxygen-independent coproporphyrinogen-3 oxidase
MKEISEQRSPGLYIHVPFCLSKCPYCNFHSTTDLDAVPRYLEALMREMALFRGTFSAFDTVYLGGGTPSVLAAPQIASILNGVRRNFDIAKDAEITVECNPADIALPYLDALLNLGVNRLNIGVQSFHNPVLRFLGRRHNAAEALAAVDASLKAGFRNTGIDLIYGVPGQDMDAWLQTLAAAVSFRLPHLSCYQLTVEEHTPLGARVRQGECAAPSEEAQLDFFMTTSSMLAEAGYIHYEVSNFALAESLASRHNRKYWDHTPYLGLGPAAHSFANGKRRWNKSSVTDYCEALEAGLSPAAGEETLSAEDLAFEAVFLGLRTRKGIPEALLCGASGTLHPKKALLDRLLDEGYLERQDGFLRPTRKGMAIADSLALL